MPLFSRPDGSPVRDAPALRRMMPFLMPTRTESLVYFDQRIDVTATLLYIEEQNAGRKPLKLTLFPVFLCAFVRTLALRPQMNRFVVGRRLYQRNNIELSFAVKKCFADAATLTTVKVTFQPQDTLDVVSQRVQKAVIVGKSDRETTSEKEMRVVTRLPRFLLGSVMRAQRVLDSFNLLPASLIRGDPLYASMFIANLGSIGIDAAYHHLYEYGTIPIFVTIGRVKREPVVDEEDQLAVRQVVDIRCTFDERIADGFYCARSLDLFKGLVVDPQRLERPATET